MAATKMTIFQYIFAGGAVLFFGFLIRTFLRQITVYQLSENGLSANGPFKRCIVWENLNRVKLNYFSTRRDRKGGWFQLNIKSDVSSISVDSELFGFERIMENCVDAIQKNNLIVSEATSENFSSSGFPLCTSPRGTEQAEKRTEQREDG
tara:strand:- start:478 stop:927 length:450 start_codon:yes stop_codon:yes gene_type:complete